MTNGLEEKIGEMLDEKLLPLANRMRILEASREGNERLAQEAINIQYENLERAVRALYKSYGSMQDLEEKCRGHKRDKEYGIYLEELKQQYNRDKERIEEDVRKWNSGIENYFGMNFSEDARNRIRRTTEIEKIILGEKRNRRKRKVFKELKRMRENASEEERGFFDHVIERNKPFIKKKFYDYISEFFERDSEERFLTKLKNLASYTLQKLQRKKPVVRLEINGRMLTGKWWGLFGINQDNYSIKGKIFGKKDPYEGILPDVKIAFDVYEQDMQTGRRGLYCKLGTRIEEYMPDKKEDKGEEFKNTFAHAFYMEEYSKHPLERDWDLCGKITENFKREQECSSSSKRFKKSYSKEGRGALALDMMSKGGKHELTEWDRPFWNFYNLGSLYKLEMADKRTFYIDKEVLSSFVLGRRYSVCDKIGKDVVARIKKKRFESFINLDNGFEGFAMMKPQYYIEIYDEELARDDNFKKTLAMTAMFLNSEEYYRNLRFGSEKKYHPLEMYKTGTMIPIEAVLQR